MMRLLKRQKAFCQLLIVLYCMVFTSTAFPETKIISAEATYIMGDGESPSFAESMVLQKAKQMAVEQAGTYVESYTKVQNYQLTTDEIQTIAGGILQVEVLEKKRELIGNGLHHYIKIKATVTTDKIQDLVQRIKSRNVAGEYKKLQEEYARLSKEIETWKQLVSRTATGPAREAALEQMREREKAFTQVQKTEAAFFQRLVSGEKLVQQALDEKAQIDTLIETIKDNGYIIELGETKTHFMPESQSDLMLTVPVTIKISKTLLPALKDASLLFGGMVQSHMLTVESKSTGLLVGASYHAYHGGYLVNISETIPISQYFIKRVGELGIALRLDYSDGDYDTCSLVADTRRLFPVKILSNKNNVTTISSKLDPYERSNEAVALLIGDASIYAKFTQNIHRLKKLEKVAARVVDLPGMEGTFDERKQELIQELMRRGRSDLIKELGGAPPIRNCEWSPQAND